MLLWIASTRTIVKMPEQEVVVAPAKKPAALTAVRSTLIGSSVRALRDQGHLTRYLSKLPAEHHDIILHSLAGAWLPVSVAEAHYGACDSLALSQAETLALGRAVGRDTSDFLLRLVLRVANEVGTTPWTVLRGSARYWSRFYVGSTVGVFKLGPKEAQIQIVNMSLARYSYWRTAFRGLLGVMYAPFCQVSYVRETASPEKDGAVYRVSWA